MGAGRRGGVEKGYYRGLGWAERVGLGFIQGRK